MSCTADHYGVVVGVDGSTESRDALRWATAEATLHDVPLRLVHVVGPSAVGASEATGPSSLAEAVETVTAAAGGSRPSRLTTEVRRGDVVDELLGASRNSFMTVIGGRGRGVLGRHVLGPISRGLLSRAEAPVAIVHSSEHALPPDRFPVLLGLDDSPASEGATALALDEAAHRNVDLVAVHAWTNTAATVFGVDVERFEREARGVLDVRLAPWRQRYPKVVVHHRLVVDHPARRLVDLSHEAQIVVVGRSGRGGLAGLLLGSVSSEVARAADAPTIIVQNTV